MRLSTEGERGLLPNKCPHGDNKVISFCPVGARWSISIVLWPVCFCPSRVQAILAYTAGYPQSKILQTSLRCSLQGQFTLVVITPKTNTGTVLIVQVCVVNFANGRRFTKWTAVRQRLRKLASLIILIMCPAGINKLQDKHGLQKTNSVSHWWLEYRLFCMSLLVKYQLSPPIKYRVIYRVVHTMQYPRQGRYVVLLNVLRCQLTY